ncbi:twin-arginine translocation signal domain-containing protein [Halostella litorea]|uniref:twin-arginine translocation signal domain-containing protein n=1 Tax=Halostella litorea TaxID=2528831 RepID=UPI001091E3F0|nr:twin-arginine translocation signal domain-containing protein [Halostella litorea]
MTDPTEHEQTDENDASETTQSKHNPLNERVSRRQFIKIGGAAAGAAAAGGTASAATTTTTNTTTTTTDTADSDKHKAPNSIDGGEVVVDYALQNPAKTAAAAPMILTAPVGGVLYSAEVANAASYAVTNMATWAWGQITPDADDAQDDQLELDVNAHAHTIHDNLVALTKQCYNNFRMLNNNALISGEVAAVKAINAGKAESLVAAQAQDEIYNQIAVFEENFYRIIESAIVRLANLHAQQVTGFADNADYDPTIRYKENQNDSYHHRIIGTRDIEVELVNGDTITTQALACNDGSLNDSTETGVVYIHPLFADNAGGDSDDLTKKVTNYDELVDAETNSSTLQRLCTGWHADDDVDPVGLYVEKYDQNNGRVYPFASSNDGHIDSIMPDGGYANGWWDWIAAHVISRAETLTADMQQHVEDIFDALATGEIENVEEVLSPYAFMQLQAGDWLQTGSTGYPIAAAWMGGYSTDLDRTGTYTHVDVDADNITYDKANILWDSRNPPKLGSLSAETLGGTDWTINVPVGSGSTLHLDSYPEAGKTFSASHSSESVDSIGVQLGTGDSATPVAAKSSTSSITPTRREWEDALSRHGVKHADTVTVSVEVTTGAGSSTTVSATDVTILIETRLMVGNEYTVPSTSTVYIADSNGMHEVPSGDSVRIESVKDADGNALEYITVSDGTLMTLDSSEDIQERWDAILEAERDTEDTTPDGDGSVNPGGGGGVNVPSFDGNIPWELLAGGSGVVVILSIVAQLLGEDDNRR